MLLHEKALTEKVYLVSLLRLTLLLIVIALLAAYAQNSNAQSDDSNQKIINILYVKQTINAPPVLSNILPPAKNSGLSGAALAIEDSNTTGKFLGLKYQLTTITDSDNNEILKQVSAWVQQNEPLIIAHLPEDTLLKLNQQFSNAVIFNISEKSDLLRTEQCNTGLLHTIASRAMLSDALIQFLISKQWDKWLLIQGQQAEDHLFSASLHRSAQRFGGKFVDNKMWSYNTDLRRTAQKELPTFTHSKDYDITLVADEIGDFGEFVLYNTWRPRPVAGTQGLTPIGWHRVVEQWGAAQLQSRFTAKAKRWMNDVDYAGWLAVRSIAEAMTRSKNKDASSIYSFLLSDSFQLAAFKGRKLSYRNWNGQLRQPIPIVHARSLVSQSPQEGYLHPITELDTLGFDKPEVGCSFNKNLTKP